MPPKEYNNAPSVNLTDYIETKRFRTVLHEQYEEPHGISEIPVELELNEKFAKTLSFSVPWDKWLYGFVRKNKLLEALDDKEDGDGIRDISLHDWDGRFLMIIDSEKGETPYFVPTDQVMELLEGCMRPPEQK